MTYDPIDTGPSDNAADKSVGVEVLNNTAGSVLIQSGSRLYSTSCVPVSDISDVTATSFTNVVSMAGSVSWDNLPAGATLYGRFLVRMRNATTSESITARPKFFDAVSRGPREFSTLEVSTDSDTFTNLDSGWVDVSSDFGGNGVNYLPRIEAKVTAGTGEFETREAAVFFELRVD